MFTFGVCFAYVYYHVCSLLSMFCYVYFCVCLLTIVFFTMFTFVYNRVHHINFVMFMFTIGVCFAHVYHVCSLLSMFFLCLLLCMLSTAFFYHVYFCIVYVHYTCTFYLCLLLYCVVLFAHHCYVGFVAV